MGYGRYKMLIWKKAFAINLAILLLNIAQAQVDGLTIHGQLKDAATGDNLINATIKLTRINDSLISKHTVNSKNGFTFSHVPIGKYYLHLSYVGYRDTTLVITGSSKDSSYNVGILTMTKSSDTMVKVIVKAVILPIITKNDTIIYNTSAFKTRPNSTVEELLKKLPGIEVDRNGNITFQGEKIQKIFIDGNDFFLTDPKQTTQNFLADMVQKVEVFDDKSERAKLTGIPDDKPGKALNLRLKPDKNKGYFGNMEASYGSSNSYNTTTSLNFLKDNAMAMINIGSNNNTSGRISSQNKSISLNYANTHNQNLQYNIVYGGSTNKNHNWSYIERQTFFADSSLLQVREGATVTEGSDHNITLNVNYKIDSFNNFVITTGAGIQHTTNNNIDFSNTNTAKTGNTQPVNSAFANNNTNDNSRNHNININYNRRFRKQGRYVGLTFNNSRNQHIGDGGLTTHTNFFDPFNNLTDSLERNQRFDQNTDATTYDLNITYSEPVGNKQVLDAYYKLNNSVSNNFKTAYNYNPITGKYDLSDSVASNGFKNNNLVQSFGVGYNNFSKSKFRYQFGISITKSRQQFINKTTTIANIFETTTNIYPRASLLYSISNHQSINLSYNGNSRQPRVNELQPLPDFSNPLIIRQGNPSLKPEFSNQLNLDYRNFNVKNMRSLTLNVNYRNTLNRIINSVTTNAQGIQEQQFVNMNGAYAFGATVNYSIPLIKPQKALSLIYNTSIGFNRDANLINREINIQHSTITSQGISLNYHLDEKIFASASGNFNFSKTKYSAQIGGNNNIISYRYNVNISYESSKQFVLSTDFNLIFNNTQRNLSAQNSAIWNFNLLKRMFKNRNGELKISAYNILNNKKDFTQSIGDNYIETTSSETVKRSFTLSFIYRFRGIK